MLFRSGQAAIEGDGLGYVSRVAERSAGRQRTRRSAALKAERSEPHGGRLERENGVTPWAIQASPLNKLSFTC